MRHTIILSAIMSAMAACATSDVAAQSLGLQHRDSLVANTRVIYIDGRPAQSTVSEEDSIRGIINQFYVDQFRHYQDPAAPYFLFLSKDSKLAMGIGGKLTLRGWFDWGGAMESSDFITYNIPITADPAKNRQFDTSPSGTSLFFRVIGNNRKLGNYQLYIEGNFTGYKGRDFKLKKAYATVGDWTLGLAPSTFSDPASQPPTVDPQGPNSELGNKSVLVRWMHDLPHGLTVALSAETPSAQVGGDGTQTEEMTDWMPDVATFLQYSWAKEEHVRLAGIMRTLGYRDLINHKNHHEVGWGLQLSGVGNVTDRLTTYAAVTGGYGVESMGNDLSEGDLDLIDDLSTPGKMYAPAEWGWYVGLQYFLRHNLFISGTYSQQRFCPKHDVAPDTYKMGQYVAANVMWNPVPRVTVGAEFDYGTRKDHSGASRSAHRVIAQAQFSF